MALMVLGEGEGARGTHPSLEPSAASQALLASLPFSDPPGSFFWDVLVLAVCMGGPFLPSKFQIKYHLLSLGRE